MIGQYFYADSGDRAKDPPHSVLLGSHARLEFRAMKRPLVKIEIRGCSRCEGIEAVTERPLLVFGDCYPTQTNEGSGSC